MSEPNMGFVVLGPVLGPADNAISHVSNHAVHLVTKGRKSEPKSFQETKNCKSWRREGMMQKSTSARADCMQLPLMKGMNSTYTLESRQEKQ